MPAARHHRGLPLLFSLAWLGCGPTILVDADTESTSDDGASSSTGMEATSDPTSPTGPPPPMGTTTPADGGSSDTSESADGVNFIEDPDGGTEFKCDHWVQDCPPGEKCTPTGDEGSWYAWRCRPVAEDPGTRGDPCTVQDHPFTGLDDCELGAMCWDVDPTTLEGHCVSLCSGSAEAPGCNHPNDTCSIPGSGLPAVCLPSCDPLEQDCPAMQACVEVGSAFDCVLDGSGEMGAAGDACESINLCDPGNFCAPPEFVPGCLNVGGCCTSYCELGDPTPCLPGQDCVPYFEAGEAPPGYETLGACAAP